MRIHITGASGSGTSTLGGALSQKLGIAHLDTDDFFWLPSDPPYLRVRPYAERMRLLQKALARAGTWVLSGSIGEWGGPVEPLFDLAVFLSVPTAVRLARLAERDIQGPEAARFAPGGDRHEAYRLFLEWAAQYESGTALGRNRALHEKWLQQLDCPVLRLEGDRPLAAQVNDSLAAIIEHRLAPG